MKNSNISFPVQIIYLFNFLQKDLFKALKLSNTKYLLGIFIKSKNMSKILEYLYSILYHFNFYSHEGGA